MKDFFSYVSLIVIFLLLGYAVILDKENAKFKKETILAVNALSDMVGGEYGNMKPILIAKYLNQTTIKTAPNGSSYIPMIYKDKESLKNTSISIVETSKDDWSGDNQSYYDINKIYRKAE